MNIKHFIATVETLLQFIAEHNADLNAHDAQRIVVATRLRDPEKPTYGLGGGGDDGGEAILKTGPYTGRTEAGVVVSGVLYDAKNMSTHGDTAPDGTIIIKMEE